jgi:hypothetical protein
MDAVKGRTRDVVCVRIHDEADAVKRGFNALKFVRGEPFKVITCQGAQDVLQEGVDSCVPFALPHPRPLDLLQEEHWNAMFKKVGMPKNVRLDTLTVGHILDAMDAIGANLAWLKDLHGRAQVR